jgi:hypothetical protein
MTAYSETFLCALYAPVLYQYDTPLIPILYPLDTGPIPSRDQGARLPRRDSVPFFFVLKIWNPRQQTKPGSLIITFSRASRDIAIVVTSHNRHSFHSNPKPLLSSHHLHETCSLRTPNFATAFLDRLCLSPLAIRVWRTACSRSVTRLEWNVSGEHRFEIASVCFLFSSKVSWRLLNSLVLWACVCVCVWRGDAVVGLRF